MAKDMNFQQFVLELCSYWTELGCLLSQPYDAPMGAGTFHPHTFLRGIGPEPWRAVYVQPCRRPVDGRYGKSSYRLQHYYQLQVLLKPPPGNIVDLFLRSLERVGISLAENDVALLEDDWKGPTLGAWGLGWEVRANGQEVTQFTYFQQLGGLDVDVVCGEITYGLERLYMYAKGLKSIADIPYNDHFTYGDIFLQNEFEFSHYNFKHATVPKLLAQFEDCEARVDELCSQGLVLPAYEFVLMASHAFNLLDARGAISVSERQRFIARVRECSRKCAVLYREEREKLGFPLLKREFADTSIVELKSTPVDLPKALAGNETCDVVLELGVEEMPSGFQESAQKFLQSSVSTYVDKLSQRFASDQAFSAKVAAASHEVFVSPRRLAVSLKNFPVREPDTQESLWGPSSRIAFDGEGKLTAAGEGFCRKNNLSPSDVKKQTKPDQSGEFLFAQRHVPGRLLADVFAAEFKQWMETIPAAITMKWLPASKSAPFIRPVRWIAALVNEHVIPVEMFGLKSDRTTFGQRILHPEALSLGHAKDYTSLLRQHGVEPCWSTRRQIIVEAAQKLAEGLGGRMVDDPSLLAKVTGNSESPQTFAGSIKPEHMALPPRLVVSALREHMNAFAIERKDAPFAAHADDASSQKTLLPGFIAVASYACDKPDAMKAGVEQVVAGRLDDGAFYYETDLSTPIDDFRGRLANRLFQNERGTLLEKSDRIAQLAEALAPADLKDAARKAGAYCKADLMTGCVQEFPDEMQGIMGGLLVSVQKPFGDASLEAAAAIADHYRPSGAADSLPRSELGLLLSLADKLDSLVVLVGGGADIKSNKDPFGLRRLALGVLRILGLQSEGGQAPSAGTSAPWKALTLSELIDIAAKIIGQSPWGRASSEGGDKVLQFLLGRMRASWREEFDPSAVEAAVARGGDLSIEQTRAFVSAIDGSLKVDGEGSLKEALVPYRRARNLTKQHIADATAAPVNAKLFKYPEETALFEALRSKEAEINQLFQQRKFAEFLAALTSLAAPMARYFEVVMVIDPDLELKRNRLALLQEVCGLYERFADVSLINVR